MSHAHPDWLEIETSPVIGPLAERAIQISGKTYAPKDARLVPMLKEDREYLIANGWTETLSGCEKICPK